tara:strand:- start:6194 stop:7006 length:813 start_codon:yes stop_codon:yes gene_type:complete
MILQIGYIIPNRHVKKVAVKKWLKGNKVHSNHTMSKANSDLTTETLKNYIVNDRTTLLNAIVKDMSNVSANNASDYLRNFSKKIEGFLSLDYPVVDNKKRKKKERRFRKISPYLAFCAHYRNSKRDSNGKLRENVLEITKQAGAKWKNMKEKDRKPWEVEAEKATRIARANWDKEHSSVPAPTSDEIREMKKSELMNLVTTSGVSVSQKATLKEIRDKLVAHYSAPTEEQICKMKKDELKKLIDQAGIRAQKDTKSMQSALISHYYPAQT